MALKDYIVHEVALDCEDGYLTRREALRRLGLMGVTGAAAGALLTACGDDDVAGPATTATTTTPPAASSSAPTSASASATSAAGPTTVGGEEIRFAGPNGELIGLLSPAAAPRGAVLVIHENRGLTPH